MDRTEFQGRASFSPSTLQTLENECSRPRNDDSVNGANKDGLFIAVIVQASGRRYSCRMWHNEILPAHGCIGELILDEERSTALVTVARCSGCETELQWDPDSDSVTIILFGIAKLSADERLGQREERWHGVPITSTS